MNNITAVDISIGVGAADGPLYLFVFRISLDVIRSLTLAFPLNTISSLATRAASTFAAVSWPSLLPDHVPGRSPPQTARRSRYMSDFCPGKISVRNYPN